MTDYKLNEQDYKRLTELLGECSKPNCVGCDKDHTNCNNWEKYLRTFNTPDDQHAVFKKLVEVRKWDGFYKFFLKKANFIIPAIVGAYIGMKTLLATEKGATIKDTCSAHPEKD